MKYERPEVTTTTDLAEGVFTASGAQITFNVDHDNGERCRRKCTVGI